MRTASSLVCLLFLSGVARGSTPATGGGGGDDDDVLGDINRDLPSEETPEPTPEPSLGPDRFGWTYDRSDRKAGPWGWASLAPGFARCGDGGKGNQSPIDIDEVRESSRNMPPVKTHWVTAQDASVVNNGNGGMSVVFKSPKGKGHRKNILSWRSVDYEVHDVRFHSPSEHSVRGAKYPLEAQILTMDEGGKRLFFSVFFTEGKESRPLAKFWDKIPAEKNVVDIGRGSLNVREIIPENGQYFLYRGSDTRPPCESASWILFKDAQPISEEQVKAFVLRAGQATSRPIQPTGVRTIRMSAQVPQDQDHLAMGTLTIEPETK